MGDMIDPVESINIAHLEVVIALKDRLLRRALIQPIPVHGGFDLCVDLVLVFWGQADEGVSRNVEEDAVVWCLCWC